MLKLKSHPNLLENVYTSQFEGAEYESDIGDLSHLNEIN